MDTLIFACALVLTLLLFVMFLGSLLKLFFTADELTEMGVRLDSRDQNEEAILI